MPSSQTEIWNRDLPGRVDKLRITWTADTDGSYTDYTTAENMDGYVFMVVTNPGATAPTDNYDITLADSDGCDVSGGELANRDTANTEQIIPKIGNTYGGRFVAGPLTLGISNNSINSATGEVIIYVYAAR
jgi:hypothetical protein